MITGNLVLLGCGILRKEIACLIAKNSWPLETVFLDSALHCWPDRLATALKSALAAHQGRPVIVLYGCCHPNMDLMLSDAKTFRTEGQNCIEQLLGRERFMKELADGAFFLLEEWAGKWEAMITKTFGTTNREVIRDIFQDSHRRLLCVRTPCSSDFIAEAEAAGRLAGLPLSWMDAGLDHLESVIGAAIEQKMKELQETGKRRDNESSHC